MIIGLGNPGIKYALTRHNVGFWLIDVLAERWGISVKKEKWKSLVGEGVIQGEKVILIKPQTYMNLSGEAVRPAIDYLKADIEDICVVYDDLDLPPGKIRLRLKGSSGGHNGMKSIIHHLGTDQFKRVKIGIGRPERGQQSIPDYVLSPFAKEELDIIHESVSKVADAMETWLKYPFLEVMNRYNA